MLDTELNGLWSANARYGPGAQSDDCLIFKPDGTGRYEFINWTLSFADLFRWEMPKPGVVRIMTDRRLQMSDDARKVEEVDSPLREQEVQYRITEEDTPSGKRMRVLRLPLKGATTDCYGFSRRELDDWLEQPRFSPLK
jgi:hypothetical protein